MRRSRSSRCLLRSSNARGLEPRQRADGVVCPAERAACGEERAPLRVRGPSESHVSCQLIPVLTGEKRGGGGLTARAHTLVQGYVSGLRKLLGPARLVTRSPGYLARVEAGELDALEFDRLVAEARTAQEPRRKAERLREALELWRGSAL